MTLKTKSTQETGDGYDLHKANERIQALLKEVLESQPAPLSTRYNMYYNEENSRLALLREYGQRYRKDRREFGKKRKIINAFFKERRGKLGDGLVRDDLLKQALE